jgi:hypothetical protein
MRPTAYNSCPPDPASNCCRYIGEPFAIYRSTITTTVDACCASQGHPGEIGARSLRMCGDEGSSAKKLGFLQDAQGRLDESRPDKLRVIRQRPSPSMILSSQRLR